MFNSVYLRKTLSVCGPRCISLHCPVQMSFKSNQVRVNQRVRKEWDTNNRKRELMKSKAKAPVVEVPIPITIKELIELSCVSYDRVMGAAKLHYPNQKIYKHTEIQDYSVLNLIMRTLGLRCKHAKKETSEIFVKDVDAYRSEVTTDESRLSPRPPIVTIMGHIDHGKTTLLDALRQSNVAQSEAGGITQAIGAFTVEVMSKRKITFLDTPGHAAFSAMRKRGAKVTDVVVLVVAADDGVMEQTIESIRAIKLSNAPLVVAVNKCDSKKANPRKVYEDLSEHGIVVEQLGGDVQAVQISALKKQGLDNLIESVLLQADLLSLHADNKHQVEGVVLESRNDVKLGPTATVIVQQGTLQKNQWLVAGKCIGKVKKMNDENGRVIQKALPGYPVCMFGWKQLPNAGDVVLEVNNEKRAKEVMEYRNKLQQKEMEMIALESITEQREELKKCYNEVCNSETNRVKRIYLLKDTIQKQLQKNTDVPELNVIVKADVDGSLNALLDVLDSYDCKHQCSLNVLDFEVGALKPSDIERAALANATIYCFNVTPSSNIEELAEKSGVKIVSNDVIYHLIDNLKREVSALLPLEKAAEVVGEAEVKDVFKFRENKVLKFIAGCKVESGILEKDQTFLLVRNDEVLYEGPASSLRRVQLDVDSVAKGKECGIILNTDVAPEKGDFVKCCHVADVKPELEWNPPGF